MQNFNDSLRVRPKKSLGQHFLRDLSIAERIAATLDPHPDLPVIEVGPGMGVLTRFLIDRNRRLRVVELDTESVQYLQRELPVLEGNIIEADFLKYPLDEFFSPGEQFALIGNFPYNISSQIFFHLLEYKDLIPVAAGMLQREVAQRLASPPGSKSYGILSVLLQAWYDIEYLFTVDEHVFSPPPKVKSGVIRLTRNKRTELGCDEDKFKRVIKTAFNQRRKTLRNSLKPLFGADFPNYSDPIFNERPERLSVEEFVQLTLMHSNEK